MDSPGLTSWPRLMSHLGRQSAPQSSTLAMKACALRLLPGSFVTSRCDQWFCPPTPVPVHSRCSEKARRAGEADARRGGWSARRASERDKNMLEKTGTRIYRFTHTYSSVLFTVFGVLSNSRTAEAEGRTGGRKLSVKAKVLYCTVKLLTRVQYIQYSTVPGTVLYCIYCTVHTNI